MSKQKKKFSLLIPKHQNKSAMEIAQMYLSQIKIDSAPPLELQNQTSYPVKKPPKASKSMPMLNFLPDKREKTTAKPISSEKTCENTALELFQHIEKSNEILQGFQQKENKLITTMTSIFLKSKDSKMQAYRKKSEEILVNFKSNAYSIDQKISLLQEENKRLKEKLAIAMLEEVDERIKRETPVARQIDRKSREIFSSELAIKLVESVADVKGIVGSEFLIEECEEIESIFEGDFGEIFPQVICGLCQKLVNERKAVQKAKMDLKKTLDQKREKVLEFQTKVVKIEMALEIADS